MIFSHTIYTMLTVCDGKYHTRFRENHPCAKYLTLLISLIVTLQPKYITFLKLHFQTKYEGL
jgi:hypothetical protein